MINSQYHIQTIFVQPYIASKKVGENNGQLRFRLEPQVAHTSRLDKKMLAVQSTHIVDVEVGGVFSCTTSLYIPHKKR